MKRILKLTLFVLLPILLLYFIFIFFTSEEKTVIDEELNVLQPIRPKSCFSNMVGSYWSYVYNDTLQDYDVKNPIYSVYFKLQNQKKIGGQYLKGATWEIEDDTLFIVFKSKSYRYKLEGCPPKFEVIYFDSIVNDYQRLEMRALY